MTEDKRQRAAKTTLHCLSQTLSAVEGLPVFCAVFCHLLSVLCLLLPAPRSLLFLLISDLWFLLSSVL